MTVLKSAISGVLFYFVLYSCYLTFTKQLVFCFGFVTRFVQNDMNLT